MCNKKDSLPYRPQSQARPIQGGGRGGKEMVHLVRGGVGHPVREGSIRPSVMCSPEFHRLFSEFYRRVCSGGGGVPYLHPNFHWSQVPSQMGVPQ